MLGCEGDHSVEARLALKGLKYYHHPHWLGSAYKNEGKKKQFQEAWGHKRSPVTADAVEMRDNLQSETGIVLFHWCWKGHGEDFWHVKDESRQQTNNAFDEHEERESAGMSDSVWRGEEKLGQIQTTVLEPKHPRQDPENGSKRWSTFENFEKMFVTWTQNRSSGPKLSWANDANCNSTNYTSGEPLDHLWRWQVQQVVEQVDRWLKDWRFDYYYYYEVLRSLIRNVLPPAFKKSG